MVNETDGMPWSRAHAVGDYGERLACRFLESRGIVIIERNWRCAAGEIDIVARDGATLVICEVKTRASTRFGTPIEQVTHRKLARLRRLAALWLAAHPHQRYADIRVDVLGVQRPSAGASVIEHLPGVA